NWWPGPPQFGTRPLDSSTRPDEERFDLTLRFTHNGTAETLDVVYRVWSSSSLATAIMSSTQSALGTSLTGPSAGDQVLYYNQKLGFGAAPYVSEALIRVGQMVVTVVWSRAAAFASTNAEGAIAKRVVSKLKSSLSGGVHASPAAAPDPHFVPPDGTDLTQLGTDRLPVEVVPVMVGAPAPADVAATFHHLGASDFVYGDYALNADTHMEVLTGAFTFSSLTGASDWLNQFIGSSSLTQSGDYFNYDDTSGQYIAAFGVGSEGVLMLCRSAADLEAASRACESPMSRVAGAWKQALGG
ncbi:MAG TPA: hypothetical protein VEU76_01465, partial [Candidatus Udaeobacter sp.]|nr:hypothetical protein [Candidatus Udaeobacter sp.]